MKAEVAEIESKYIFCFYCVVSCFCLEYSDFDAV